MKDTIRINIFELTLFDSAYQIFEEVDCNSLIGWQIGLAINREEIEDLSLALIFRSKSSSCDLLDVWCSIRDLPIHFCIHRKFQII